MVDLAFGSMAGADHPRPTTFADSGGRRTMRQLPGMDQAHRRHRRRLLQLGEACGRDGARSFSMPTG